MHTRARTRTQVLTHAAILAAITIVLACTPLGYIPINPIVTVTLMCTPVVLGGLLYGWKVGLFLGLVFGITSFIRAPGEALGQMLLSQSIILTFLGCVVPRALVGLLGAGAHKLATKYEKLQKVWFYAVAGLAGSLLNTVCFLGFIGLAFDPAQTGITGAVIWGVVSVNGSIEAVVNAVLVGTLAKVLTLRRKS